eukprot:scaffold4448_cov38-Cyclotella_meneghiniana.AAC.4
MHQQQASFTVRSFGIQHQAKFHSNNSLYQTISINSEIKYKLKLPLPSRHAVNVVEFAAEKR